MSNTSNAPIPSAKKKRIFSESTVVPLSIVFGILIPLFCTGVVAVWVLRGEISKYDNSLSDLTAKVEIVDKKIEATDRKMDTFIRSINEKSWTYSMMRVYTDQARYLNPNWISPDYRQIKSENTDSTN